MTGSENTRQQLDAPTVVAAYRNGYFPMADPRTGIVSWYSPDPRAVIPLDEFRISRSLRQRIAKRTFTIHVNRSFDNVIRACAEREDTWISEEIIRVYGALHHEGLAHSVESWHEGVLVGGLYGVAIGGAFFGESMFSRMTDASKVALAFLVDRLKEKGFTLLDTQFINEHIRQFGTREIPRSTYLVLLRKSLARHRQFDSPVEGLPHEDK